jgi:ADP-ribose pyrophosphatase YjhB (NUDIX family)
MDVAEIRYHEGRVVSAVVIKANEILLVRYHFGDGNVKYMLPGCRILHGEAPKEAIRRGCMQETGISIEAEDIIFVRLDDLEWQISFRAKYLAGVLKSPANEPFVPFWVPTEDALKLENLSFLCKEQIKSALSGKNSLRYKKQLDLSSGKQRYFYAL